MLTRRKFIYVFLSPQDRQKLQAELQKLENAPNVTYIEVSGRDQMIQELSQLQLLRIQESIVIQIVAHGNLEIFGADQNNSVSYNEISDILSQINQATNGWLILNLMTVCNSYYPLAALNQNESRFFGILIGCTKKSYVEGSISHSCEVNNLLLRNVESKIEEINENRDKDFSPAEPEFGTYVVVSPHIISTN